MNKIILVLTTIMLLSVMGTTSTANYTIDSDKVLNISGVRTFPVFLYDAYDEYDNDGESNLSITLADFDGELYGGSFASIAGQGVANVTTLAQYENNKKAFTLWYSSAGNPAKWDNFINSPSFLAFHTFDEGQFSTPTFIKAYQYVKRYYPNKLVFLNHCCSNSPGVTQSAFREYTQIGANQTADILSFDTYTFKTSSWYIYHNHLNWSFYGYEELILGSGGFGWFDGVRNESLASANIPIWATIQTHNESNGETVMPSPQQLKTLTYLALTFNVMGISYFDYNSQESYSFDGMSKNATMFATARNISKEIHSINDALILPTTEYSWEYDRSVAPLNVSFNPDPTRTLISDVDGVPKKTYHKLNYRFIRNETSGISYLIVVNKDDYAVNDIKITISGLSGAMTATTLGLETSGSQASGRTISITNGTFTDSFDGYAVHIYKITPSNPSPNNPAPIITSWSNTKTNNVSTSFSANISESINFNVTANQTISTWNWINDGTSAGNNTDSYTTSFTTGGSKTITVTGTNANVSSNIITWTVSVPITSSTDSKIGLGGVAFSSTNSYFDHATINKGDGKVTVGLLADNCNDGTSDWVNSKFNCANGTLNALSTFTEARQNISEYTNVTLFFIMNESSPMTTWGVDMRALYSRDSISKRYAVVRNDSSNYLHLQIYNGTWNWINSTTFTRTANAPQYHIFSINGFTLKSYISTISFADAMINPKLTAIDPQSLWSSGDYITFEGKNIKLDDIRLIEYNRFSGSININYNAGANNQTNSVIIKAITPENTNYTISYRQKYVGSWTPIGEAYTGNQTISIHGTKYQDTEINITLYGNGTSFPDIEIVEFTKEQVESESIYPRYDINEDGIVDKNDMILVSEHFNEVVSNPYPRYDVNMDGLVNIEDITIVGQQFGKNF